MTRVVEHLESGPLLRVRLPAHPSSVPVARRFVIDGLMTWGRGAIVDDAALCVTELASNATLHAGTAFFEVAVRRLEAVVRLSVSDDSRVPLDAVVPPPEHGPVRRVVDLPTTGRGLAIVARLASAWGVDRTPAGKLVWLDLTEDSADQSAPADRITPPGEAGAPTGGLPAGWYCVRLEGCPVGISQRQDEHLDELVREMQLIEGATLPPSPEIALVEPLLLRHAHARHAGRRIAQEAVAAGLDTIDMELPVPRQAAEDIRDLHEAVLAADALCEAREMLTLASPPEVQAFRAWMVHEFEQQVLHGRPPTDWRTWSQGSRADD